MSNRRLFRLPIRRKSAWEREVEDEILLHLSLRAESLARQGMDPTAAHDEAIRRFGPLNESRALLLDAARHREERMMRTEYFQDLRQDVGFALRTLGRNRGWAAITIGTLALGIGATTAVWSAASSLLLHPLSYPNGDRVVLIEEQPTGGGRVGNQNIKVTVTPGSEVIRVWRDRTRVFEAIEPWGTSSATLTDGGEGTPITSGHILPTFIAFAGAHSIVGPGISEADVRDKLPVAALSEALWRTRFGGEAGVIGKTVTVDGVARRIVGVYPSSLRTPQVGGKIPDLWTPIDLTEIRNSYRVVGRLRAGATPTDGQRELAQITQRWTAAANLPFEVVVNLPGQTINFRDSLILLVGAVGLVLLVACANIAHLLLARGIARERELAIRTALGAARARLARLLMTESFILAAVGTALGVGLGAIGLRVAVALRPTSLRELRDAHLDGTGLALVAAAALTCALLFSLANLLTASRRRATDSLRGSGASGGRRSERFRSLLVVSEMAMSGLLLVGAVLLVRTVINMQQTRLGFEPANLQAVVLELPGQKYPSAAAKSAAIAEVEAELRRSVHIRAIAVANSTPDNHSFSIGALEVQGEPAPPPTTSGFIPVAGVARNWFETVGAHFAAGGTFTDTSTASNEVIVNSGFARKHWKGGSALGQRIRISFNGHGQAWLTIVGVVDDILTAGPSDDLTVPSLYFPRNEHENPALFVRTDGNPDAVAAMLKAARLLKPTLAPTIVDAERVANAAIAAPRFIMTLLAAFTVLAVILAAIGLYGVMSYSVAQRTREIGIRIALGATPSEIGRSVLARGTALALVGAAAGLGLAVWATRLLESQLYGVKALDGASFAIGAGLLVVVAIAACVVPTRRAISVDPISAIRAE